MKSILLTQNKVALIDDEDFERLNKYKWCAFHLKNYWYATRNIRIVTNRQILLYMHRIIMDPPSNVMIDHADGNGLNNQKSNLRICTSSQNIANTKISCDNTTGFKGVAYHKLQGKYTARVQKDGVRFNLGVFINPKDAALAYDKAALEMFGEFARLNFPNKKEESKK